MTVVISGTNGITNDGGYTGDGVVFANTTPANTLVTDTSGAAMFGISSNNGARFTINQNADATLATSGNMNSGWILQGGPGSAAINLGAGSANTLNSAYANNAGVALPFDLKTGGSIAARFSNGSIFVGATSYSSSSSSTQLAANGIQQTSVNGFNIVLNKPNADPQTAYIPFFWNNGLVGYIAYNGAGGVQYNSGSDARLKENIVDAPNALSVVSSVRVRSYDWVESGAHDDYGFIAQELHEVYPRAVAKQEDKEDGSMNMPWGVDNAKLVPVLVKAIQEQQAIITALTARVAALEGTQP